MPDAFLEIKDLKAHFPVERGIIFRKEIGKVKAVDGVTLTLQRGEILGLVGESGCGKSTLGRTILQLIPATEGAVVLAGKNLTQLRGDELRHARADFQMIFQDPYASLNPRMTVFDTLAEAIQAHAKIPRAEMPRRVTELMEKVGLSPRFLKKYPHEFSGGQRQRIGIERALAAEPELIVCDEAVSALDVSVKAQIVNLLQDLQREFGLALLFISHDLAIVEHMTHRVAVMYLGKIVEVAPRREIFAAPRHPYTKALLSAVPLPEPGAQRNPIILGGDVPSPINPPKGCRFHTRCPFVFDRCRTEEPELRSAEGEQWVACHLDTLPAG